MGRDHLSNDEFFTQLVNLFEHNRKKGHGSVYLTQKRLSFESSTPPTPTKVADDPLWDTHPTEPLPILIRANNNGSDKRKGTERKDVEKITVSTVVKPDDLDAFFVRYAEACRAGMSALKKRDRKKGKKDKKKKKVAA
ncbi:signal recognition particle, SRP9/SRP14 subunit [Dothidotthia symphoricarpi CBS 119687]|uniref:Signal recognition particle subunit SRP14 n=1 Tax=Dothidotthia symphoricarpi CBS 119687 TaxID=1392245 RepID=A0A6A6ATX8_9PLEO|nr:signal recognition particle, SRP9/SRP14 subunit [Dothidotthia symphoricarpi CBS 119687]KAF2134663.1 signal recognition particle, SRP9/SRP14 subunit [Dothidotthia symphoricarpi CBS 119687]